VSALLYVCNQRVPFAPRIDSRRERRQKRALHPAKIVSRIMMVRGITVDRLAAAMRVDIETLKQFLGEQLEMNEELAENLSRVLGHDKNYWLELCPGRGVVQEKSA
jgi:plasmid maintenance system antidote protein VapI